MGGGSDTVPGGERLYGGKMKAGQVRKALLKQGSAWEGKGTRVCDCRKRRCTVGELPGGGEEALWGGSRGEGFV